jgi:hypothetical protein
VTNPLDAPKRNEQVKPLARSRAALAVGAAELFAARGGSPPPIGAPGAMPQRRK